MKPSKKSSPLDIPTLLIGPDSRSPSYAKPGDAGADLYSRIDLEISPKGGRALVPTGVSLAIPEGFAGFVQPRSGLAIKHGVTCLNSPGLIDSGYRGEISVVLINHDPENAYQVRVGDRIAQLVVMRIENINFLFSESLDDSERGTGGFGHSGS